MMKQATPSIALSDVVTRDLELLSAFGSQFSPEDISSAYCQSNHNVNVAGNILCSMNGNILGSAMYLASKDKLQGAETTVLDLALDNVLHKSYDQRNTRVSEPKNLSLSVGTVSGVIGKEYIKTKPLTNKTSEPTRPMKLDSNKLPTSEILSEEIPPNKTAMNSSMLADVQEFLFRMLQDGFQIDKTEIEDVFGCCGHDIQKSTENLFEFSALTLEKCDDTVNKAAEKSTENCPGQELLFRQERKMHSDSAQSDAATFMTRNFRKSPKRHKGRFGVQKEVLESLFIVLKELCKHQKLHIRLGQ